MKLRTIATIALVTLLVAAGTAAALPGNAPEHAQAPDDASNGADDAADLDDDTNETATDETEAAGPTERSDRAGGPPESLPAQVPEHVGEIHDAIRSFLDGSMDGSLGETLQNITPDDETQNDA